MHCSELDIVVDQLVNENGWAEAVNTDLYCKHYRQCMRIYNQMKKDWEENHVTKLDADHA
jgi:hypothetical protein